MVFLCPKVLQNNKTIEGTLRCIPTHDGCYVKLQIFFKSHRELLKDYGIIQSMMRKANCWENTVSESFFHTLKQNGFIISDYQSRTEAKQAVFEYIEVFYNRERIPSANNYLSAVDYEIQMNST